MTSGANTYLAGQTKQSHALDEMGGISRGDHDGYILF